MSLYLMRALGRGLYRRARVPEYVRFMRMFSMILARGGYSLLALSFRVIWSVRFYGKTFLRLVSCSVIRVFEWVGEFFARSRDSEGYREISFRAELNVSPRNGSNGFVCGTRFWNSFWGDL